MVKGFMTVGGLWLAASSVAWAQESSAQAEPQPWGVAMTAENDVWDYVGENSDRYYTQGLKLILLGPDWSHGVLPRMATWMSGRDDPRLNSTIGAAQHMYTPEELLISPPDPDDRPYAGWAYGSMASFAFDADEMTSVEAQIGVVGPRARAGETQNAFHRLIEAAESAGWDHQLKNEPGFNLYVERRRVWSTPGGAADLIGVGTGALGTVEASLGVGLIARLGWNLDQDFGPPRLRPGAAGSEFFGGAGEEWGFYAYAGGHARAVAHDVFLDGNVFRDHDVFVEKEAFVPEWSAGAVLTVPRWRFWGTRNLMPPIRVGYAHVWVAEQFRGQNGPLEYGSWTISFVSGGRDGRGIAPERRRDGQPVRAD